MQNNNCCFLIAMEDEMNLEFLNNKLNFRLICQTPFKVFQSQIQLHKFIAISSIGMINCASLTQFLIDKFKIDNFVNLGSSGTFKKDVNPFDKLLIKKSYYGNSDLTTFGYKSNQMARQPEYFLSDDNLNSHLEKICQTLNFDFRFANCCSVNSFINSSNFKNYIFLDENNYDCVEMELIGLTQICHLNNKKWCSLKIISDSLLNPKLSSSQFKENLFKISKQISLLITKW